CRLTALVAESGAEFWLSTPIVDTLTEGNRVIGVVVSTPTGLGAVLGKVVIDATGDGTVAALAGAESAIGRDSDGLTQPCTIEFLISGVDESIGIAAWGGSDPVKLPDGREYRQVCRAAAASGELPSNVTIVRLHRTPRQGDRSVNATQYNGLDAFNPASVADAERVLRGQIEQIVAFLRRNVPGYENIRVVSSAGSLGVRETRRIIGDYVLGDTDVEQGTHRADAAVRDAWFLIDIHNPAGGGQAEGFAQPAKPYDIPFGCLLPRGLEGIMTAGRCISGTHRAHASYRVMAICLATGEAAGMVAAQAVKTGKTPREVAPKAE
ncbi:MAG: FAD-dependent oxidoreductase, partial [Clostridia bacterium]|nr:FAD-dependent oxidoreductase [Clostridia bacterium]